MVRNTKFCSGPTVNVQDTIFHLFVKPPFQGCPGQGRGIFEGHLWWASLKGRSHTSVVRGLVFSFQFFHNSDEKMKVIQPLKLDIDFYDVVVIFEGHPWGATLRGIFEGHLWRVDPTHQWWEDLSSPFSFFIIQMKNESDPTTQAGHWLLRCRRRRRSRGRPGESGLLGVPISKLGGPY